MRKTGLILSFILIFTGLSFAQNWNPKKGSASTFDKYVSQSKGDSSAQMVYVVNDTTNRVKVDIGGAKIEATITDVGTKGVAAIGNNSVTVGTAAVQVSSTSTPCRWISIINNSPGSVIYVGSSTVSASNGFAVLQYKDAIKVDVDNLTKLYLISTQANTDCRYMYGN